MNDPDLPEEPVDSIVEAVRDDLLRRSQIGIKKYGVTLDGSGLSLREWLEHAYLEALDLANYLKRAIVEISNQELTNFNDPSSESQG